MICETYHICIGIIWYLQYRVICNYIVESELEMDLM